METEQLKATSAGAEVGSSSRATIVEARDLVLADALQVPAGLVLSPQNFQQDEF